MIFGGLVERLWDSSFVFLPSISMDVSSWSRESTISHLGISLSKTAFSFSTFALFESPANFICSIFIFTRTAVLFARSALSVEFVQRHRIPDLLHHSLKLKMLPSF